MRAGLITGERTFELVEVPEPEPGDGQALVQVDRCGICGSDVSAYRSGKPYPPILHGHEWTGTVLGGRGITQSEGDRVVLGAPPPCGRCSSCRGGRPQHCELVLMMAPPVPPHGGYAPRINVDGTRLHAIPDHVSADAAALVEPATVALHGVRRTDLHAGDRVLVTGAGAIGLLATQIAALAGAEVVVVEPDDERRAMAARYASATFASTDELDGRVDVAFECAGANAAVNAAARALRNGGQLTLIGVASGALTIESEQWLIRELTVRTALAHTAWDFDASIRMVADGRLDLAPLAQRTVTLDGLPQAFAELADGTSGAVKVLVDPQT
ncbi:MAG: alcohol dehydrogenase catalytic domain-containing protein [Acidimicrobiia bacterium]